ncbi:NADPH:quinone reductase [Dactylosporangium sp. AC04546]|uniref:NADPH:quinone reductase n=1 Tax=Dactylosporangium sp. AC04546 TaxID=2862460 RepID=UPI001EDFD39C|nr:NADPH:quinone reductase [Dactylosporangium sp. AC04546]WVK88584.1 NADPH:quinone reductase [Dactylosporangium sp. AC04546]
MRAAYIERLGPAEEIRCGPLPDPVPGPTDVLVEVTATTVNAVDTFVRSGLFPTPLPMPFVVGRDLVGTVLSADERATGFAPGDVVWCNSLGHAGRQGAAAERAVVPMERLYRVPPGVPPRATVAAVFPAGTAYLALFTHGRLRPGDTVIVEGAAGHVGAALVAFAVDAGARVVATAAADDAAYCTALGADEVVDYRAADRVERLAAACPGGAALYLDTSGRNDLATAMDLLAFRGRIVVLAGASSQPVLPVAALYMHDRTVSGFVISHATAAELAEAAVATNRLLAAGQLRPRATVDLPLSATAEAHAMVERGELRGRRVVITPGD